MIDDGYYTKEKSLARWRKELDRQEDRWYWGCKVNWHERGWQKISYVAWVTGISQGRIRRAVKKGKLETKKYGLSNVKHVNVFDVIRIFEV